MTAQPFELIDDADLTTIAGGFDALGMFNGAVKGGTIGMVSGALIGAPAGPGGAALGFAAGMLGGMGVGGYLGGTGRWKQDK